MRHIFSYLSILWQDPHKLITLVFIASLSYILISSELNKRELRKELKQLKALHYEAVFSREKEIQKILTFKIDSIRTYDRFLLSEIDSFKLYNYENPITMPDADFDWLSWARERYDKK